MHYFVNHVRIVRRADDEEEGDFYYEYHVIDEDDKVVEGTRWTHHSRHSLHYYNHWLFERGFRISSDCQLTQP